MLTADTINDEQIRRLWRERSIDTETRNDAIRVYRDDFGASLRRRARAHCAEILNARAARTTDSKEG